MTHRLDSSILIKHLRATGLGTFLYRRLATLSPTDVAVASPTRAEVLSGRFSARAALSAVGKATSLLQVFRSLPFDDAAADAYAREFARLLAINQRIGQIAAIALRHKLTVVTNNLREFSRVGGLRCEDWSAG